MTGYISSLSHNCLHNPRVSRSKCNNLDGIPLQVVYMNPLHPQIIQFHTHVPQALHHGNMIPYPHIDHIQTTLLNGIAHTLPGHMTLATFFFPCPNKSSANSLNFLYDSFGDVETHHPILRYSQKYAINHKNSTCYAEQFC